MKNKNIKLFTLALLGGTLVTTSCNSNQTAKEEVKKEKLEQKEVVKENNGIDVNDLDLNLDMEFKVPTPNELFEVINETGIQFNSSVLNPTSNLNKYENKKSQALNFGVYSADLAFIANNEVGSDALKYFKTIRELSSALNVENAFNGTVFNRIEENVNKENKDSLLVLSNETYYNAFAYLEDNGRQKTLAYIVVGGWIESLSILTQLGTFKENSLLAEKIGDQRLTLENIMGLLMKNQEDEEVADLMADLVELEEVFFNLEQVEEGDAETTQNEDGQFMFSGGTKTIVSKEDFEKIKTTVADLRTQIIEASI